MMNAKRKKVIKLAGMTINVWVLAAVVVLVILLLLALSKKQNSAAIKVTVEEVQKRTLTETVAANGKIQPETEVKISPYISGEVVELHVKEGDEVKSGDLLAKIDPEIYISSFERTEASVQMQKANLANAKARHAQSKAQLYKAEEDFKRNQKLYDEKVISQADFDAAKLQFDVAKEDVSAAEQNVKAAEFTVNSAEASLREARENLLRTAIYAPNDGIVSRLNVEKGERVTGASQFSSGTEIMRIANLDRMQVSVEVNENDIIRVSLYDTCIIEVDAFRNRKFKGIVTEIATSANITGISVDQITNFEVKVLILQDSYEDMFASETGNRSPFRPGMSATVDIQTETAFNVLTVPIQAVTALTDTAFAKVSDEIEDDSTAPSDELRECVFLYDNGIARIREVKTGIQDNRHIQILEGVEENDQVITGPYRAITRNLKDGKTVNKVEREDLFKDEGQG